jgi:hypothetical protein
MKPSHSCMTQKGKVGRKLRRGKIGGKSWGGHSWESFKLFQKGPALREHVNQWEYSVPEL